MKFGVGAVLLLMLGGCARGAPISEPRPPRETLTTRARTGEVRQAQVWKATDVPRMDLRAGPSGKEAFAPQQPLACDYVRKDMSGTTPKFTCRMTGDDEIKVKYGAENGEVYASVMATRLFWALGFGADAYYPVRVTCRGCPADPWKTPAPVEGVTVFDHALVERKMAGETLSSRPDQGWKWPELDLVDESQGGASRAQRDALKLLASMVEHIDSKDVQQRLVCLPGDKDPVNPSSCVRPFLMVHDLGVTFGSGGLLSRHLNRVGAANFKMWAPQTVFRDKTGCVGSVSRNFQGNLNHPVISEAGRKFLADLLAQLSDRQLHDLFAVARVDQRSRNPGSNEPPASIDDWVQAFKRKREEITNRKCPEVSRP
jgi:hypothetical protein